MLRVFGCLWDSICGGKYEEIYKDYICFCAGLFWDLLELKFGFGERLLALFG